MPLLPADIVALSRLLDEALALPAYEREAWMAALAPEDERHAAALREMLAKEAALETDPRLVSLPQLTANVADEAVARTGDSVGPYRLIHEIGRGGMGSVWLAERADGNLKRQIALKLPRLAWGAGLAERMARERDIGALLEHPNIARLYDAGLDERGRPYLALEFIDGQPIDAWCKAQGLDLRRRLRLFVQVARAVAYAHGRLVVHRDLKPTNVLVTPDGQTHLLDFGIAKLLREVAAADGQPGLTQELGRVLTPHYASPEQVAGQAITVQSDVYSLGVLLYELLTDTLPIAPKRGSLGAVEDAILEGDAPLASGRVKDKATARALRGEVDAILAKAMQREPGRRYATADALAQDIERHLNGETVAARPDSLGYRMRKGLRRHWVGASAAAAVLVAVLTGSSVAVVQAQRATRAAERERVVKEFVAEVFSPGSALDASNTGAGLSSPQALLERGAQLISSRFAGQPQMQADLYGVVSRVFADMGAYNVASDYSVRRVELLTVTRASATETAHALLAVAQSLLEEGRSTDAEPQALRAIELARDEPSLQLEAMVLLARIQLQMGKLEAFETLIREVDEVLVARGAGSTVAGAWAIANRGSLLALRNRLNESIPLSEKAIELARAIEGRRSITAVTIQLALANRLGQTNHGDLALRHFEQAAAVLRSLGGAHAVRAALAQARFAWRYYSGGGNGTLAQVIAALEGARADLNRATVPVPPWFNKQIDYWLGSVMAESGDVNTGLPMMEAGIDMLDVVTTLPWERQLLAGSMGNALMYAGRHDHAQRWFSEDLGIARIHGFIAHPYSATLFHNVAENLLMQDQLEEAEAALDGAPRFEPIRGYGSDVDRYSRLVVETRAQIRLARGDAAGALALISQYPRQLDVPTADDGFDRTRTLLGEVLCAVGRHREGLPMLRAWLAEDEASEVHPNAPWLARLRALTGLCAAGSGDPISALKYATQARAAFAAQPGVSNYYKAPLFKLERALGLKLAPI